MLHCRMSILRNDLVAMFHLRAKSPDDGRDPQGLTNRQEASGSVGVVCYLSYGIYPSYSLVSLAGDKHALESHSRTLANKRECTVCGFSQTGTIL